MTRSVLSLDLWHDAGPWQTGAGLRSWIDRLDPDPIGFQEVRAIATPRTEKR